MYAQNVKTHVFNVHLAEVCSSSRFLIFFYQDADKTQFLLVILQRLRRSTRRCFTYLSNLILRRKFESCSGRQRHNVLTTRFFFVLWVVGGLQVRLLLWTVFVFQHPSDQGRADLVSAGRGRSGAGEHHPLVVVTPWTHPEPHLSSAPRSAPCSPSPRPLPGGLEN